MEGGVYRPGHHVEGEEVVAILVELLGNEAAADPAADHNRGLVATRDGLRRAEHADNEEYEKAWQGGRDSTL